MVARSPTVRLVALLLCPILAGCAAGPPASSDPHFRTFERRCRPVQGLPNALRPARPETAAVTPADLDRLAAETNFTLESLRVARTIGVLPLLEALPQLEREAAHDPAAAAKLERVRTQLSDWILFALLQVSGVESELTCEAERADQLADRLALAEDDHSRMMTIVAILTAGVGGIVGSAIAISDVVAGAAVGVASGAGTALFSALALRHGQHMPFKHPRNLLRDVWEGPVESDVFPQIIWRYLNGPLEEDPSVSVRSAVVARWRRDGHLGTVGSALEERRVTLLFGAGGEYRIDDFRVRAQMLEMLQGQVGLMNQYLERFLGEVLSRGAAIAPLPH